MEFKTTTVKGLFDSGLQFRIPVYQRAYSWQKDNWLVFLDDIKQQVKQQVARKNSYSFGSLLLETIKKEEKYDVIDGQQRLTTIVIFMRALYNVLQDQGVDNETLDEIYEYFFKRRSIIKLRPVENDRACFDSVIVDNESFSVSSPSQECIVEAKKFFIDELSKLSYDELLKIKDITLDSSICRLEMEGKKEAALMFELQNNRGRDLTNMEKLKSYFMYQMYVLSSQEETDSNIETISNYFKEVYKNIYDINGIIEDSILIYHCNAYLETAFGYRNLNDLKGEMNKKKDAKQFIIDFSRELSITFANLKRLQSCQCNYYKKLCRLNIPSFVYPFIIKGYKFFGDDEKKLDRLFHVLEILSFRYHLISSRADLSSRLSDAIRKFDGDIDILIKTIDEKLNEAIYWGDTRVKETLSGSMYGNSALHYLLWEYEESIQNKGYKIGTAEIENEQIEHISPQTEPQEAIATGYDVDENNQYGDDFREKYINSLGNLMLISGSHNASIGNKPFSDKLHSYNENPLLNQQAEIKSFLEAENIEWKKNQIQKRLETIVKFAINRWSFKCL
jgi:uncharacterized protein with ParB-like and HNH nuclease domain